MKRRWMSLLLVWMLLLSACQFPWKQETEEHGLLFYYLTPDNDRGASMFYLEQQSISGELTADAVLQQYLCGPQTDEGRSAFPQGMTASVVSQQEDTLHLAVSKQWNLLSGVQLQLARACMTLTMTQLPQVEYLYIDTEGESGAPLTAADFLLYDDSATSNQSIVKLYFSDGNGRYLLEETRSCDDTGEEAIANYIVQALLQGPQQKDALAVLPEGTNLLSIQIADGICTVDLSEAFCANRPATHTQARMTVFSVVNSLTELPQITGVRLLCVGKPVGEYVGLNLSQPLQREETALKRASDAALDMTLYLPCGSEGKLAQVPFYVRRSAGRSDAETLLNALLSYSSANGYNNPIPDGTMIAGIKLADGLCEVRFNSAFSQCDADPTQAVQAVQAVTATMCTLDDVNNVKIIINDGAMNQVDLSQPMMPQDSWFLP